MPACQVLPSGNLIPHSYATWEFRLRGKDKINFLKMRWSSDKPLLLKSQSTVCHRMYISVHVLKKNADWEWKNFQFKHSFLNFNPSTCAKMYLFWNDILCVGTFLKFQKENLWHRYFFHFKTVLHVFCVGTQFWNDSLPALKESRLMTKSPWWL